MICATKQLIFCQALMVAQLLGQTPPDATNPVPTFQTKTNLVLVPAVVRDPQGRTVGNLTKDDFQLFDKGKRQTIASFSLVNRGTSSQNAKTTPERFLVYLFDDLNTRFDDMAAVRQAAERHLKRGLRPSDRAAIYSFSGHPNLDFTGDVDKLENAVSMLRAQQTFGHGGLQCPDINYYIADMIVNRADQQALRALAQQTAECSHVGSSSASTVADAIARRELIVGEQDTRISLGTLKRAIRRLAAMPGQRLIVLASAGFYVETVDALNATTEILDLAARSNVTISALDARGLYNTAADSSQAAPRTLWVQYRTASARANGDVLAEFAEGTGGTYFHSNNDLNEGFERVTAAPEFSYVLGFSPASLKADGSFHPIKLKLANEKGFRVEGRRGYYAIKPVPEEQAARAQTADAVFSQDEMSVIPVTLQTGHSKPDVGAPKLLVVARVGLKSLHFKKVDDRSVDTLTVASALFDADGSYVGGNTKTADLKLSDKTLAEADAGVTLRFDFDVKPGTYRVRLVVRESEGTGITALNRMVTIP